MTATPLRVLMVEDSADDAELLARELRRGGYAPEVHRVDTAEALAAALDAGNWDLLLADYSMPGYSGTAALQAVRARGLDLPFIFVSGTIGEDVAVTAMRAGAQDYVTKGNVRRLLPAIERELREAGGRRERVAIEAQLRQAQKMEAIGQLTGGLAHDFNNLLTVILGNLDLLRDEVSRNPNALRLADTALRATVRGADLTRQLLAFARQQSLETRPIDLNQLVEDAVRLLGRTLGEHIEIGTSPGEGLWPALADPAQLEGAIVNLAINARDAMPQGGRLLLETGNRLLDAEYAARHYELVPGDYVMVAVADTGTGIAPELIEHVFEPFFTTKGPGKGTGLGLSQVYGFIRQSHGHVTIDSTVGQGTVVRLYLPRAGDPAGVATEPSPAEAKPVRSDAVILVVEDNADVRSTVVLQLGELGYRVIEAANAAEALLVLRQPDPVDLLFTDVVMPGGLSGIELAREARHMRPGLKVLLTSGFIGATQGNGGEGNGHPLLRKPYRRQELARRIAELIGNRAAKPA